MIFDQNLQKFLLKSENILLNKILWHFCEIEKWFSQKFGRILILVTNTVKPRIKCSRPISNLPGLQG